jgi:hypothetical protein
MLAIGIFPAKLKFSEVRPIFKEGDESEISNYRLVSLLTSNSKIFEKVIYNRLFHHIEHNHILANEQFVFKYESSMVVASCHLINNILTALNNKLLVSIFCDLCQL